MEARDVRRNNLDIVVFAGLDPAIRSVAVAVIRSIAEWMPGSSPGMTTFCYVPASGVFA
jgi:hypothetical protein